MNAEPSQASNPSSDVDMVTISICNLSLKYHMKFDDSPNLRRECPALRCWSVLTGAHSFTRMNRVAAAASWRMVTPASGFIDLDGSPEGTSPHDDPA